jgi:Flp pilus assembly protein TadD
VTLFALLFLTEQRVRVWHDEVTLWKDTLRHNPRAYHGHFMLGADHEARGRLGLARREFEAAVADCPRDSAFGRSRFCAYFASKLGFLCARGGDADAAGAAFEQSLAFSPGFPPAYVGLGHLRLAAGDIPGARQHLQSARATGARLPVVVALIDELASAIDRAAVQAARED